MKTYVGLDVSLDETSICIVTEDGKVLAERKLPSTPEAIAAFRYSIPSVDRPSGPAAVRSSPRRRAADTANSTAAAGRSW